jgi:hypothetical protein
MAFVTVYAHFVLLIMTKPSEIGLFLCQNEAFLVLCCGNLVHIDSTCNTGFVTFPVRATWQPTKYPFI